MREVRELSGVGKKREEELNKLGVETLGDLCAFYPSRYLDFRTHTDLRTVSSGSWALFEGELTRAPVRLYSKARRPYLLAECRQGRIKVSLVWFHADYVFYRLEEGKRYLFYGRLERDRGKLSVANPEFEPSDAVRKLRGILPVYPLRDRIPQGIFRNLIPGALKALQPVSVIPDELAALHGLADYGESLRVVHSPQDPDQLSVALKRVALEDFFQYLAAHKVAGGFARSRKGCPLPEPKKLAAFLDKLPYRLTEGQQGALSEILKDLRSPFLMNRLLQGDVGCGKTAVAMAAAFCVAEGGFQTAFLAPTEVLARQHYETAQSLLSPFGIKTVLLTGAMKAQEREKVLFDLREGVADLAVGTHALLGEEVVFKNLRLCVCDEQQRFGVRHRTAFSEKAREADVLSMTATPIPRTMALMLYGELSVSTIAQRPAGRGEVRTRLVTSDKRKEMLDFLCARAEAGEGVYVVCPLIEDSPETDSVEKLAGELRERGANVGVLHGGLRTERKEAVLRDFKMGKVGILVSTTVVEVGVDHPDATVMCVMGADRFGLSQLHQLRGRVGRGKKDGWCLLYSESEAAEAWERLKLLRNCSDGFKLSEQDFAIRGGGDLLGTRQSGMVDLPLMSALTPEVTALGLELCRALKVDAGYAAFFKANCQKAARKLDKVALN